MRNTFVILIVCALVGGLAGMVYGQVGPDLFLPYVDPGRVTMDGLGTEWEDPTFYPQDFMVPRDGLGGEVLGGEMPPVDDWDCILYLGWSAPPDNMVYGYARISDDILQDDAVRNGDATNDDMMELVVDGDNSGGDFREGWALKIETAYQLGVRMTETPLPPGPATHDDNNNTVFVYSSEADVAWITAPEFFTAALDYPEGRENVTYAYEWKMALWDVCGASPEESQRHMNQLGDVFGLALQWDDSDGDLTTRDHQPGTNGPEGRQAWTDADFINDAYLVENPLYDVNTVTTAVEPTAWGAVKASLK
jgi:hypothetical protein